MRLRYFAVIALVLPCSVAWADGCYVPQRAVRKFPSIPTQRALLTWKEGVETLVISSALDSESQSLGWIIPLPNPPTSIEKATPGMLKTLDFCIQPQISHVQESAVDTALYCAVVANVFLAIVLFSRRRLLYLPILLGFAFVLPSLFTTAGVGGPGSAAAVSNSIVQKSVTVGAYRIAILKPARRGDLNDWLTKNDFSVLPDSADAVVDDYVARSWVFAAVKLWRDEAGANTPHPIKMDFPAAKAVYPVRLTALAGGATRFELHVIASQRAACDRLATEYCDSFAKLSYDFSSYEPHQLYVAGTTNRSIAHPALTPLLWNKCVLTKLAGTLRAAEMTQDLSFTWQAFVPYQEHFITESGAQRRTQIIIFGAIAVWLACFMIASRIRMATRGSILAHFGPLVLLAVVLIVVGWRMASAVAPQLADREVNLVRWVRPPVFNQLWLYEQRLKDNPSVLERSEDEIAKWLCKEEGGFQRRASPPFQNRLTGADVAVEDSPGNFMVEKRDGMVRLHVYDDIGRILNSQAIELPSESGKTKAKK